MPKLVGAQIDAIIADIGAHAVKTGMLANAAIIDLVANKIRQHRLKNIVVDPVMVATSGDLLIEKNAVAALRSKLIPSGRRSDAEHSGSRSVTGMKLRSVREIREKRHSKSSRWAPKTVSSKAAISKVRPWIFFTMVRISPRSTRRASAPKTPTAPAARLSAAIAAYLAKGQKIERQWPTPRSYITDALRHSYRIGAGHSPVHHFFRYWKA